ADVRHRRRISLIGRFAVPLHRFFVVAGGAAAEVVEEGEVELRGGAARGSGAGVLFQGFSVVLDAFAAVQVGEFLAAHGNAGVGRFLEPLYGFVHIPGNTVAVGVHHAEIIFGGADPLIGGLTIPFGSLAIIPLYAFAGCIEQADVELRVGVAPLGERQPFLKGRLVIAAVIGRQAGFEIGPQRR